MKNYKNIPIIILHTGENIKVPFQILEEDTGKEKAYFRADIIGRFDYDETLMVKVGENEIPFEIITISVFDNSFPIRFKIIAKQVGAFSSGRWDKILAGISDNKTCYDCAWSMMETICAHNVLICGKGNKTFCVPLFAVPAPKICEDYCKRSGFPLLEVIPEKVREALMQMYNPEISMEDFFSKMDSGIFGIYPDE